MVALLWGLSLRAGPMVSNALGLALTAQLGRTRTFYPEFQEKSVLGRAIFVDHFGNVITNVPANNCVIGPAALGVDCRD